MTDLEKFIVAATKEGELELGPNALFDRKYGRYYGFSWLTGPMFASSIERLLENMITKARNNNYKKVDKVIFIIERNRDEKGRYDK